MSPFFRVSHRRSDDFAGIKSSPVATLFGRKCAQNSRPARFCIRPSRARWRMLARAAAAEIFPGDNNRIFAVELAVLTNRSRIKRLWQAAKSRLPSLLVFVGNGWYER